MTTKPYGDEPAMSGFDLKEYLGLADWAKPKSFFTGFTKLERACIDLKVPDPALDPKLRELILESRRLDANGLPVPEEVSKAILSQYFTRVGLPVPSDLEKK